MATALPGDAADLPSLDALVSLLKGITTTGALVIYTSASSDGTPAPEFTATAIRDRLNTEIIDNGGFHLTDVAIVEADKGIPYFGSASDTSPDGYLTANTLLMVKPKLDAPRYNPRYEILAPTTLKGKFVEKDRSRPVRWPDTFKVIGG